MRRNDQVCPSWHIEGEEICWIMLAGTMKRLESIPAVGSESATVSRPQVRFGRRTNRPEDPSKKICRDVWEKQNPLGKCFWPSILWDAVGHQLASKAAPEYGERVSFAVAVGDVGSGNPVGENGGVTWCLTFSYII